METSTTSKEKWEPVHSCEKRGPAQKIDTTPNEEIEENSSKKVRYEDEEGVTLATITQTSKHHTFHIKSTLKGQKELSPLWIVWHLTIS